MLHWRLCLSRCFCTSTLPFSDTNLSLEEADIVIIQYCDNDVLANKGTDVSYQKVAIKKKKVQEGPYI
jgi:hypothetical protein